MCSTEATTIDFGQLTLAAADIAVFARGRFSRCVGGPAATDEIRDPLLYVEADLVVYVAFDRPPAVAEAKEAPRPRRPSGFVHASLLTRTRPRPL
jgi:hypothetical protein